ncbi:MAG: 5-(carboxyamino)imidazole ribonucleotide synthase [Caldimicrobium sp.]|nr:5-(carboxyamino)imidazole ribonucleotide synthase [Caldimicrobium sp.]MCX7613273.1 5-(carboxyamino)imidazole ribonucleotide synthase [Caldimicrobium sp.]MDW8182044.1 5-(carboxyamino)imidazole ribonucleotide synthase [Caldimicrobium sp.]
MNPGDITIGILGGGQLAKMSAQAGRKMGFNIKVLDPTPNCPASTVAEHIIGSYRDSESIISFASHCDIITFDIEHAEIAPLKTLENKKKVIPSPRVLEIIQNKLLQRKTLKNVQLPVPEFREITHKEELRELIPVVQKSIKGGYDGRGTVIIRNLEDLSKALDEPSFVEEFLDLEKELGVIVARNEKGDIAVYEVVEMVFHPEGNLLDYLFCPASISEDVRKEAKELAIEAVRALDGVGLFGVELFLDKKGKLYINEIAPRPHNSGHHTIEACYTSQFEQHIRVVTGLPLGATTLMKPCAMFNLLGEEGYTGKPIYEGLEKVLAIPGVSLHVYGKAKTYPLRKMGHVTIVGDTLNEVLAKMRKAKAWLKVKGEERI